MSQERPDGEVVIKAGGQALQGWTEVSIAGGLDTLPAIFELGMTEAFPGQPADTVLNPGDACTIEIGGDLVLTGWINRYEVNVTPQGHTVRVSGRSRCQDLVDCSAIPKSLQISGATVSDVAKTLVAPFAGPITVQTPDGDGSGQPYVIGVSWGQTPWEIISEIATYEGLLVHDDARGDLVICKVGTTRMASGFQEGVNVQEFGSVTADDQIYSLYIPALMAQDSLAQIGPGGNNAGAPIPDPLMTRYRPLVVVSDQMVQGQFLARTRAIYEATRRRGRGRQVRVLADSWRDSAGTLWTHNVLAPVELPTVHVTGVEWIIAGWNFIRDDRRGTVCELTLMAPEAFAVAPSALNSQNFQIALAASAQQRDRTALGDANPGSGSAITAPNAGANDNPRTGEGYGL